MILNKKHIIFTVISICITAIALLPFLNSGQKTHASSNTLSQKPQIILDAGHGGFDGGAVAFDGTVEKDINLNITLFLSDFLKFGGYDVILTRQTDTSTDDLENGRISARKKSDLKNRLKIMSEYPNSIFVSIHLNKFTTSSAYGSQVFYSGKTENSRRLSEYIQNSITSMLQPYNKRVNKQATSSTFILHNATVPAVLVECGFLSNPSDLEQLKTEEYQKKMAFCIFCGIAEYFSDNKEI